DVFELVNSLLGKYNRRYGVNKRIRTEGLQALQNYGFPGNVRELKNLMKKAVVMNEETDIDGIVIQSLQLSFSPRNRENRPPGGKGPLPERLQHYESEILREARGRCRSTREMATVLGISQPTVVRKMKKYQISPPSDAFMHQ
ncbi:MAG: Fis family transcriptional regulator, partial [Desulfobacterales bacterium]